MTCVAPVAPSVLVHAVIVAGGKPQSLPHTRHGTRLNAMPLRLSQHACSNTYNRGILATASGLRVFNPPRRGFVGVAVPDACVESPT